MADDLSTLSYEAAVTELDEIIARLERGDVDLEAAITAYERGAALARHCAELLDRTEQKITQLVVGGTGEIERPFQPPAHRAEGPATAPVPQRGTAEQRLFGDEPAPATASQGAAVDPDDIPF